MSKKENYQYFNNISQRINLTNDTKSQSVENLESLRNNDTSSGWFTSLSSRTKSRLAHETRQNSCTSSEAGSQISSISNNNNSKNDVNEGGTINNSSKSKLDSRTNENSNRKLNNSPLVALRNSNRSTSKLANNSLQKADSRKQSKEEANDQPLYHRFSSPEPEFLVPNQVIYQNYLNYLKHNNLNLDLNHLNQLNELNYLHQLEQLYQLNQLSQFNQLQSEAALPTTTNQPSSSTTKTTNTENEQQQNITVSTETSTTEHQTTSTTAAATFTSTATNAEQLNNSEKPQLVQCPQLTNNSEADILNNSTQQLKKENLDSDDLNKQQLISEQVHRNQASDQLVCDQIKNLNLSNSESYQTNKENFQLVKELFDANAHLYMSVEQMAAMEELIRNNPRTCRITLETEDEELGFNLNTKKKPNLAHIVKKVNPYLAGAKSGIQEGDQLLMVNGVDCRNLTHQQVVKLLGKRGKYLKLVVCQPKVYQWYLKKGYDLKLDYDDEEQENVQDNQQSQMQPSRQLSANSQINRTNLNDGINTNQQSPISYNERCVDDIRPIQVHDQIIPYVDNNLNYKNNLYKDNQINQHHQSTTAVNDDPFSSRNSFKRSYKLKKNRPSQSHTHLYAADDVVDESLSMSTSVSPFDERYGELRDDIFNNNRSLKTSTDRSNLNKNLSRSVTDNYNYESKNIEYNEYMDSSSHKLEKSETTVEISNDEFQNKKFTRKSIERLQKKYEDQPMKNVLPQQLTTRKDDKSKTETSATAATTSVSTTTRSSYTPVYSKTSQFSNSLFDKPKTTSSIFDRPSSIFDNKYENKFDSNKLTSADKLTTTSKTSYLSPTYNTSYNQSSYSTQNYSSSNYKNESSYSKSYISPLSNQTTAAATTRPYKSPLLSSSPKTYERTYNTTRLQTTAKEPYIERHVIEPKEAQLVHIDHDEDEQDRIKKSSKNQPNVQQQYQPHQVKGTKTLKTVQANTPNDLPAPRLCTLKLPKDRIVSFGFTIKTSRKTNAKVIVDIVRNSIAHRAGLRVGDIICEVNECFVGQDTHQQVTDRIKAASEEEVRLLVVTEPEMDIYRNYGLVPSSEQSNVILVQFDSELNMPLHTDDYEDTDCLQGCGGFLDNLSAKQYRNYLKNNKKRPEPANNPVEFEDKIKKFEKL